MRSIYQARYLMDKWLADKGLSDGPVEIDVDASEPDEDGEIMLYASTTEGTFTALFTLPPGYPHDTLDLPEFFLAGKQTFEWC